MKKAFFLIPALVFLGFFIIPQPAQAETLTVPIIDDSFTNQALPDANYGASVGLVASNSPKYKDLWYRVNGWAIADEAVFQSAKLHIYVYSINYEDTAKFYVSCDADGWVENELTWNNQNWDPMLWENITESEFPNTVGWKEIDVSTQIQYEKNNPDGDITIVLYSSDTVDDFIFATWSTESADNKPYVTIEYQVPVAPAEEEAPAEEPEDDDDAAAEEEEESEENDEEVEVEVTRETGDASEDDSDEDSQEDSSAKKDTTSRTLDLIGYAIIAFGTISIMLLIYLFIRRSELKRKRIEAEVKEKMKGSQTGEAPQTEAQPPEITPTGVQETAQQEAATEAPAQKEKTESKPETEPETEPETKPETEPETEPETKPETEPETGPGTEPKPKTKDKPKDKSTKQNQQKKPSKNKKPKNYG